MFFGKMSPQTLGSSCFGGFALSAAFALPFAAPASANILITIDKSTQQMSVAGRWRRALRLAGLDRTAGL
jgi:hypothetical protein